MLRRLKNMLSRCFFGDESVVRLVEVSGCQVEMVNELTVERGGGERTTVDA